MAVTLAKKEQAFQRQKLFEIRQTWSESADSQEYMRVRLSMKAFLDSLARVVRFTPLVTWLVRQLMN